MRKSASLACIGLLMAALPAVAGLNIYGERGVHKTQSAQTLGHGKMGIGVLLDYSTDPSVVQDGLLHHELNDGTRTTDGTVEDFMATSLHPFISLGLSEYFDLGISLPLYIDKLGYKEVPNDEGNTYFPDDLTSGNYGDLRINSKIRLPIEPEDYIIDLALLLGGTIGVSDVEKGGVWVREPEYIYIGDDSTKKNQAGYGNGNSSWKVGAAATLDFNRLESPFPLLVHMNYTYRSPLSSDYTKVQHFSIAAELQPKDFITFFAEYYMDMPATWPQLMNPETSENEDNTMDLQALTAGGIIHTPVGLDFYLGLHAYLGGSNYIQDVSGYYDENRHMEYNGRVHPAYSAYGGITWSGYLIPQDFDDDGVVDKHDKCIDRPGPRENDGCPYGDPDVDGDGVCDAWVSEKGLMEEYEEECEGIDVCPNDEGELEDGGCPVSDPDQDEDGVCDPWVSEKGMLKRFRDMCSGFDKCPSTEGSPSNEGCPLGNPDMDDDGVCDPWVSEKGQLDQFADVCKGYDKCPNEPGEIFNDGCKLPDPDIDGDGVCDAWVTEKKMGFHYKDKCSGTDQCPHDVGRLEDNGCPVSNPDMDNDSVCDPWVSEKGMLDRFTELCKGFDKCPSEAGSPLNEGCPMPAPDVDEDGVCDAWVAEKMLSEHFKDVCVGIDRCPLEAGSVNNNGCAEINPDLDGDGLCDSWVAEKGQLKKYAEVCTGIDKCPNQPGDAKFEGCPAPKIEAKVNLKGVNFMSGKSELTRDAKRVLDGVADQLIASPTVNIEIHGHTDNVGNPKSNQKLSEQRAQSVVNYLASKGVKLSRMKAKGFGADMPVADNSTASGREENRRIEMLRAD